MKFLKISLFILIAFTANITKAAESKYAIQDNQNQQVSMQDTSKVYTCPMHPDVVSSKPGNCPQCGMALVLRTKDTKKGMGMPCMGMQKSNSWMFIAGGAMMIVMMTVMVLRIL